MANNNTDISRIIKGQIFDLHPLYFDEGAYAFAQNAVIENIDGDGFPLLQNEMSNILAANFPPGFRVVGVLPIVEQDRVLFFLANPTTGDSQIGEIQNPGACREFASDNYTTCDSCVNVNLNESTPLEKITQIPCGTYTTINDSECLNFDPKFPINAIVYRILACSIQVFWTDDNNNRRYIEFEYIDDDPTKGLKVKQTFFEIIGFENPPCDNPIYGPDLDCNRLNVQPTIETPCINFNGLVGGGGNKAGVYQFFVAMSDVNGNKLTSFLSATNPIPIFTKEVTVATDYDTDRAISLTIENMDINGAFRYYILAVAKTINNVTSFSLVGTFPVTQKNYTYTGNNAEFERKLTADDIFALYPYYTTAGTVAQSNGLLFWGNLKESIKPNFQRVANNIRLQWQTIAIPEKVYFNPANVNKFRSHMRDEVYPFAIQFIFDSGEESNAYHIPGREAVPGDLDIITNDDAIPTSLCSGDTAVRRWQVYNTATLEGGDLDIYDGCNESCYQFGDFAFWESSERYPNNPLIWGDLCGQQIRHHKFPDATVTHIHDYEDGAATYVVNNLVFPIGVKVDHNSVRTAIADAVTADLITQEDADRIVGYRILRGNRFGNKSIVAKGLLYDMNLYQRIDTTPGSPTPVIDQQPIFFANYPFNDLRENEFITNNYRNYQEHNTPHGDNLAFTFSNKYTFHSPDTHFNNPAIGTELKLETAEYGQAESYFDICDEQAKQRLLSAASYILAFTGGIVGALLRTETVEVAPYTIRGVDISALGVAAGTYGPTGVPPIGPQAIWFETNTGLPLPAIPPMSTTSRNTFQGTREQWFSGVLIPIRVPALSLLAPFVSLVTKITDTVRVILEETNVILDLIRAFTPYRDWCIQSNAVGKYNNYSVVPNDLGQKRRLITTAAYLDGNNQTIDVITNMTTGTSEAIKINNLNREDSLFLQYDGTAFPTVDTVNGVQDESRVSLETSPFNCGLNVKQYLPISSYYASLKNYVPDQYGTIFNVNYLRTESCYFTMDQSSGDCRGVYGGDIFINRFALKVKVPYFLATTFKLPKGTDFNYSLVTNLAFPRNYYDNTLTVGSEIDSILDVLDPTNLPTLLGQPKSIRVCDTSKFFYQNGYIYLYHYGIPYFLVESDYNVDYRYAEDNSLLDFYPHQQDLDNWLQEKTVPISEPNHYFYNNSYSKQNRETSIAIDGPEFEPGRACRVDFPNRIIYADGDNWLVYKADNFYDYPLSKGAIISLEGIENQTVLVRSENNTSIFKSILRLPVDGQTVQVGNGSVFSNPPQSFGETTLGYVGTQHKAILHTEYGHVWADAKRGQVFNMAMGASGLDEISKYGMKNWFKENLPFRILRSFSNMPQTDIDNNLLGLGLCMSFDKRFNRFTMTKLDFKSINSSVLYNPDTKEFFILVDDEPVIVQLGDPRYFRDCSWTISYNFFTKSWVSFHSYKPNYYVDFIDFFSSGVNGENSNYWVHGLDNGSYQVFYGRLYPFIVEPVVRFKEKLNILNCIEFDTDVKRYQNEFDYTIKRNLPGFNKAIIYNDLYNSGLLNLVKVNKQDLSLTGTYPIRSFNNWQIEVAAADYKWRINQFYALNKDNSDIPFFTYKGNNAEKDINPSAINYFKDQYSLSRLRGQWFKVRLINDLLSNYKIEFKLQLENETTSFR